MDKKVSIRHSVIEGSRGIGRIIPDLHHLRYSDPEGEFLRLKIRAKCTKPKAYMRDEKGKKRVLRKKEEVPAHIKEVQFRYAGEWFMVKTYPPSVSGIWMMGRRNFERLNKKYNETLRRLLINDEEREEFKRIKDELSDLQEGNPWRRLELISVLESIFSKPRETGVKLPKEFRSAREGFLEWLKREKQELFRQQFKNKTFKKRD